MVNILRHIISERLSDALAKKTKTKRLTDRLRVTVAVAESVTETRSVTETAQNNRHQHIKIGGVIKRKKNGFLSTRSCTDYIMICSK